jgi:hypothetical protein
MILSEGGHLNYYDLETMKIIEEYVNITYNYRLRRV